MDGWRIRRGLAGDVPFFAVAVLVTGAVVGAAVAVISEVLIRRRRATGQ